MRARYLPLLASAMAVQASQAPSDFANKLSLRIFNRPLAAQTSLLPLDGRRASDFSVHITDSCTGPWNGRVLHVLTNSLPHSRGGYALRTHAILEAERDLGIEASAITRLGYPAVVGKLPFQAHEVVDGLSYWRALPPTLSPRFTRRMRTQARYIAATARRTGASVLHVTTPWTNAVAASWAAAELAIPWIYEVRGEPESTWAAAQRADADAYDSEFYRASRAKESEAMRAAAAVVVLSEHARQDVAGRAVSTPISVIPNCIPESTLHEAIPAATARAKLGLDGPRYVGAVSSLVSYEGFDDLIRAMPYLPADVKLLLVGQGASTAQLVALAREEGLEGRVHFAGWKSPEEAGLWYSALDVFVVPRKDTRVTRVVTPMKALRAQAQGIPVVASDLPALREVTGGEATYVPAGNPQALADGIHRALSLPRAPSAHAQHRTWASAAAAYEDLYSQL